MWRDPRVRLRLVARSQRSFGAVNPVSARLPVSSISRAEPDARLDLGALGRGALVVPQDRRAHAAVARRRARRGRASGPRGRCRPRRLRAAPAPPRSPPPVLGVLLGPARAGRRERVLGARRGPAPPRPPSIATALTAGGADVEADQDPLGGYRTASSPGARAPGGTGLVGGSPGRRPRARRTPARRPARHPCACCASRSAASSIRAATPSMNRHCSTLRRTAAT